MAYEHIFKLVDYRIDSTDIEIMELLTKDCRLSYREIALTLGITTNTVKRRTKNLVSRRVIEDFLVRVNLGAFGYSNIRNLTIKHMGNKEKIRGYLQNLGYVFLEGDCVGGISRFVVASKERIDNALEFLPEKVRHLQLIDIFIGEWESDFVFTTNDLRILKCLIQKPRMKVKDIAQAIHVSQKTVKRRLDAMLYNRVIDFTIFVNPREMKGYVNVGIFIHVEKKYYEEVTKEIYKEIKDLLVFGSPYENLDTMGLNLYVENMWEIERIQTKAESMKGVKNMSIVLPLRRRYSHELLLKEIDRRIAKPTK
jgi:Lrp/AsnC family leucine-responsive transcriptional regulator